MDAPAKSLESVLAYCIWKSLIASHGDGKDSSNAAWNLNKRGSQKTMAPDTINPCESPGGWKAIIREKYLNSEVTKFCQDHLSTQERSEPWHAWSHHFRPGQAHSLPPAVEVLHLPWFTIPLLVLSNQGKVQVLSHSLMDFSSQDKYPHWFRMLNLGFNLSDANLKSKFLMTTAQQVKVNSASALPLPANRCLRKKHRKGQVSKTEEEGKYLAMPPQWLPCSVRNPLPTAGEPGLSSSS